MVICHCRAVNDRTIRDTIAAGAQVADQIASGCGAGSRCGGCLPALAALLAEHDVANSSRSLDRSPA